MYMAAENKRPSNTNNNKLYPSNCHPVLLSLMALFNFLYRKYPAHNDKINTEAKIKNLRIVCILTGYQFTCIFQCCCGGFIATQHFCDT